MSRPPTLETVAERAGVSRATVSRVVNGDDRVADALRVAVEDAISELGFVPNHAARSLAMRRTGVVALIVGDTDPWPMAGETRDAAAAADLQLLVLLAGDAAANARVAAYARHHVDGVLLLADDDELVRQLAEWRVPVVVGGRVQPTFAGVATVDVDNVGGGRLAAQRLLDRGRRRLGIVAEPVESAAAADREAGFRQAADVEQVVRGDGTTGSGERAMRALLETAPGIEGVFVAGDQMALGALHVLAEAGRRVPDDVAVVGFDDLDLAAYSTPPLTTIRVPWAAQASQMVGVLVDRIAGRDTPASVVLDVELVERESA